MDVPHDAAIATAPEVLQQPTPPPAESRPAGSTDTHIAAPHNTKQMDVDEDNGGPDMLSPMSAEGDKQEESELPALPNTDLGSPSMGYDFSNIRVCAPCLVVRYHCSATYFIFSLFHPRLLLFCAPEASFMGPSSRSAKKSREEGRKRTAIYKKKLSYSFFRGKHLAHLETFNLVNLCLGHVFSKTIFRITF